MKRQILRQNSGQAALISIFFVMMIMLSVVFGVSSVALNERSVANDNMTSSKSFYAAEAGIEDAVYRYKQGKQIGSSFAFTLNDATASVSINSISSSQKQVVATGDSHSRQRIIQTNLSVQSGANFGSALQAGDKGISMGNTALINGNVYSNGSIQGANSSTIAGDARVAENGTLRSVIVQGDAYANTIQNSQVCGNAYYSVIDASSLNFLNSPTSPCPSPRTSGIAFPNSANLPAVPWSITDSQVAGWEAEAEASGTYSGSCPFRLTNGMTVSSMKINCNVVSNNTITVTINTPLWVRGDFSIGNGVTLLLPSSYGGKSGVIIVDYPENRSSQGKVSTGNTFIACGSGGYNTGTGKCNTTNGSYLLIASMYSGSENAIGLANGAHGAAFFAPYGRLGMGNNVRANAIAAKEINLANGATIDYETGLAVMSFDTSHGGGGSWSIDSWKEIAP